jgi:DNA invertase Pin-like site-specific DNA recombinase
MFGSLPRGRSFITRKASVGSTHWWTGLTNWGSRKLSSSTTISAVPDQAWWKDGFQRLVGEVCTGEVGAVFCIEASRLARNGRDWHHLIELCGMVGAVVVDPDGVYDPPTSMMGFCSV